MRKIASLFFLGFLAAALGIGLSWSKQPSNAQITTPSSTSRPHVSKSQSASGIQATTPKMPLLEAWMQTLKRNEEPRIAGRVRLMVAKPVEGIDWEELSNDSIVEIEAKFYNNKADALLIVHNAHGNNIIARHMHYWDGHNLRRRSWIETRQGWLDLVENRGPATAILRRLEPAASKQATVLRKLVLIRPQNENIEIVESLPAEAEKNFRQLYRTGHDRHKKAWMVYNQLTRQPVAQIPQLPLPKFAAYKNDLRLDARQVGDDLIVAGTEEVFNKSLDLVWHVLPNGGRTWKTTRKPLRPTYLQSLLLPQPLAGMRMDPGRQHRVKVWKDGSIIFLAQGRQGQGDEQLVGLFLIMQPRQGRPRLLSWEVYYSYSPPPSDQENYQSKNKSDASAASMRVWFPTKNGKVASRYLQTDLQKDFFFDVDGANNAVIYLLGGQLWAVDLSGEK